MSVSVPLVTIDFRTDAVLPAQFNNGIGLGDGTIFGTPDGAVVASPRFTRAALPHDYDSWLDSFKFFTFLSTPVVVSENKSTRVEADIATRQIFSAEKPIPECLYKRVRNIYEDLRLGSSGITIIDPDTGLWYAILGTDHQLWAVYGRLPIHRVNWPSFIRSVFGALGIAKWVPVIPRCLPYYNENECHGECQKALEHCVKRNRYDATTFQTDENYLQWKKCINGRRLASWLRYQAWIASATAQKIKVYDWNAFIDFDKTFSVDATKVSDAVLSAFQKTISYQEYQQWVVFNCWKRLKKVYLVKHRDACAPEDLPSCSTDNASSSSILPVDPKIFYEFGGVCGSDGLAEYAAFVHAVPLIRREAANPQIDFDRVAIVFEAELNQVHFEVNGQRLETIVKPGHRLAEEYRLVDYGGYAETISSQRFLVGFGNFTFLDGALPNNYNRQQMEAGYRQKTGLAQILPDDAYYQIAFNKHGELEPVIPSEAFGVTNCSVIDRIYGQGTILVIRNLLICQNPEAPNPKNKLFVKYTELGCESSLCGGCEETSTVVPESSSCESWIPVNPCQLTSILN